MGSISPKEIGSRIRHLRTERNLSQDDLAKALSVHRQTISLLEQGKRELTAIELDTLANFLQISYDDVLAPERKNPQERVVQSGVQFQPEKLRQMLLVLLHHVGGFANVGETVLYKLLYFSDFNHYEKTGKSISGMTYKRMQFGPVPQLSHFSPVVEKMLTKNQINKVQHEYFGMPQTRYIPLCDPESGTLDDQECQTIADVVAKLGLMNATQIEEYVHGDVPWEATEHQQPIPYDLVLWRTEPYAVRSESELLGRAQDAAMEDVLQQIEPMTAEEIAYYESLPDARHAK